MTTTPEPVVSLRSVTKRFGAPTVLADVDLDVRPGEILALLGENGAGKTTLTKIVYGMYQPDEGELRVGGVPVRFRSPADAIASGIGLVSQHFALVPSLTVAENVVLGREGGALLDRSKIEGAVLATAERYGLDVAPRALVRAMSVGAQQRVEILKALHRDCRLLILDEPTAVLTPQDGERLFTTLDGLRERGLAVIIITHKLREVMRVSQRVVVLRHGRVVGERATAGASQAELALMMIGREQLPVERRAREARSAPGDAAGLRRHNPTQPGAPEEYDDLTRPGAPLERGTGEPARRQPTPLQHPLFQRPLFQRTPLVEAHRLTLRDKRGVTLLDDVSFDLYPGELVGVAAVAGNGQSELVSVLTGMTQPSGGEVLLSGQRVSGLPPAQLARLGVGRVPEDRLAAVVGNLSVRENLTLEHIGAFTRAGHLDGRAMAAEADRLIAEYQVKAKPGDLVRTLSGGNIQKIVLARTLSRKPRFVVVAQPTRGLDVGATAYVHERLLEQRDRNAAVLMVSEDLDEVLRLSDRVLVMYGGRIVGDFAADEVDVGRVGLLMAGEGMVAHG
ncbi:MAG: ABC transporter ATP-binding protein [Trueperaceae bacterium]|nr:ABC transporter ATP-binding protein [Trueperaceae bacterium]